MPSSIALSRSPIGLILQASGQDAVQAGALGFNITKHKLAAFIISAFFSGLSGALLVFYMGTASVSTLVAITVGVQIIIAAVIGGRRTIIGAAIGTIFLIAMTEALRSTGELATFIVSAAGPRGRARGAQRIRRRHYRPSWRARLMAGPLLQVQNLTKRFGGLVAVKGMTFDVAAGEIVGLIGPNGSGKSTVMKCVMGIERPTEGAVRIAGVDVAGQPAHQIARQGVGIVFQHSRPLQRQTVLENIKLALLPDSLIRLLADPAHDREARAIAERVGLTNVLDRRPSTLPFADSA